MTEQLLNDNTNTDVCIGKYLEKNDGNYVSIYRRELGEKYYINNKILQSPTKISILSVYLTDRYDVPYFLQLEINNILTIHIPKVISNIIMGYLPFMHDTCDYCKEYEYNTEYTYCYLCQQQLCTRCFNFHNEELNFLNMQLNSMFYVIAELKSKHIRTILSHYDTKYPLQLIQPYPSINTISETYVSFKFDKFPYPVANNLVGDVYVGDVCHTCTPYIFYSYDNLYSCVVCKQLLCKKCIDTGNHDIIMTKFILEKPGIYHNIKKILWKQILLHKKENRIIILPPENNPGASERDNKRITKELEYQELFRQNDYNNFIEIQYN